MDYSIEVFKDNEWKALELFSGTKAKYNIISNIIGEPNQREISHSNTYSLPKTRRNKNILGLREFNNSYLVRSLNSKYDCRISIRGNVVDKYYLVINNIIDNININIIDRELGLLDNWGEITYQELLNDDALVSNLSSIFQNEIQGIKDYVIDNALVPIYSSIVSFPNTLNVIGDKFNVDENGDRISSGHFNVYQSRPIWNVSDFLWIICSAYGYTAHFLDGVDEKVLETSYFVSENSSEDPDRSIYSDTKDSVSEYYGTYNPDTHIREQYFAFQFDDTEKYTRPVDIPGYVSDLLPDPTYRRYEYTRSVYSPDMSKGPIGTIQYDFDYLAVSAPLEFKYNTYAIFRKSNSKVVQKELSNVLLDSSNLIKDGYGPDRHQLNRVPRGTIKIQVQKSDIESLAGQDSFIGIVLLAKIIQYNAGDVEDFCTYENLTIYEEYYADDVIPHDEYGQYYLNSVPNLTLEAPATISVKKLLSLILQQQGLMCDINEKVKQVRFYNYETVKQRILNRDFYDWSDYLLKYEELEENTDFGDKYANINKISLDEPYAGNVYPYKLSSPANGKRDNSVDFKVEGLKDVSGVKYVNIGGSHPYFEYTNQGLGLVSSTRKSGYLEVYRVGGIPGGGSSTSNLDLVENINYSDIPIGVRSWYEIIDFGMKIKGSFLLPTSIVKTLDKTKPVYLNEIRACLIIEEIKEYVDSQTPVEITFLYPGVYSSLYL
jgi:hypothetical protein